MSTVTKAPQCWCKRTRIYLGTHCSQKTKQKKKKVPFLTFISWISEFIWKERRSCNHSRWAQLYKIVFLTFYFKYFLIRFLYSSSNIFVVRLCIFLKNLFLATRLNLWHWLHVFSHVSLYFVHVLYITFDWEALRQRTVAAARGWTNFNYFLAKGKK